MKKADWDVVVIGGGPAGMMAAAHASARGRSVVLLEKNRKLGKKLAITGGGRCNVTNNRPVVRDMLGQYRSSGKFLFSTFMQHGVAETIAWFKERGVELVEENEGRLFPETQQAETIRATLAQELVTSGVTVKCGVSVTNIARDARSQRFTITTDYGEFCADSCVVATGGSSYPETGSTGEGFLWLQALGHTVVPDNMALVPLAVAVPWISRLSGITLPEIKIAVYLNNKKHSSHGGKLLFTHVGITGPTVLNLSHLVGELLIEGPVTLKVDFLPNNDTGELKALFTELLAGSSNKKIKNVIAELVPAAIGAVILEEASVDGDTPCHSVSKTERVKILQTLKAFPLPIKGLLGSDKAIVSAGGVVLEEVDFKTMESRIVPGLYLVGDVLNINRPSGGYSLQLCWSTGVVAGSHA